jgi:hypothetical protein
MELLICCIIIIIIPYLLAWISTVAASVALLASVEPQTQIALDQQWPGPPPLEEVVVVVLG